MSGNIRLRQHLAKAGLSAHRADLSPYAKSRQAMLTYLESQGSAAQVLADRISQLNALPLKAQSPNARVIHNLEALEGFLELCQRLTLTTITFHRPEAGNLPLELGPMAIEAQPDLILKARGRYGPVLGALKLHLSRRIPLSPQAAQSTATLMGEWLRAQPTHEEARISPAHCMVWDIFAKDIHRAPAKYGAALKEARAACQELANYLNLSPAVDAL